MIRILLILLLLIPFNSYAHSGIGPLNKKWKTVECREGNFQFKVPVKPTKKITTTQIIYQAKYDDLNFVIVFINMEPLVNPDSVAVKDPLLIMSDSYIDKSSARVISDTIIEDNIVRIREIHSISGKTNRVSYLKFIMIGLKYYEFCISVEKNKNLLDQTKDQFFNSIVFEN